MPKYECKIDECEDEDIELKEDCIISHFNKRHAELGLTTMTQMKELLNPVVPPVVDDQMAQLINRWLPRELEEYWSVSTDPILLTGLPGTGKSLGKVSNFSTRLDKNFRR